MGLKMGGISAVIVSAVLGLFVSACTGGNTVDITCVSANNDACIVARVDYNTVAGVTLPTAPDEAVASIACANVFPNDIFVIAPADAPPVNGFSLADPTFHCPDNLDGAVLGTCEVLVEVNPDYTGPTTSDSFDIAAVSGIFTVTGGGGLAAADAANACDSFKTESVSTADHYVRYSTWTAAVPAP